MPSPPMPGYRQLARELESDLGEPLAADIRHLLAAGAAEAHGDRDLVRAALRLALERGVERRDLEEVLLQTMLFCGYPRAINALADLAGLTEEAGAAPVDLDADLGQDRIWRARGEALCRRVYGDRYERLLETMGRVSPVLGRWMVNDGYGKVLSRPGPPSRVRELAAVAALVPLRVPDQLRAHLRGALFVGAAAEEAAAAVRIGGVVAVEELEPALRVWEGVRTKHGAS